MKFKTQHFKQWGSVFFILLLLAFKCADLHQFTHDSKKAKDSCTICQLAHAQSHTDTYVPPQQVAFKAIVFTIPSIPVAVIYQNTFSSEPLFGIFLNKAPPVA
ncbi:MAG TPA: hypothetical protein ENH91_00415 [Leeuwenhoekiella sp.]|nr:hypothetical protein [Leeuwenhoekiella sp.]